LEFHQLELRHADLRIHDPVRRARLLASLAAHGQQVPVVVVAETTPEPRVARYVLIDGYLRVAALRQIGRDTVAATLWPVSELDALVQHHHLSSAQRSPFEQAWFLTRLRERGLSLDELAKRLCRTKSWVSRRLALVSALSESAQAKVRQGTLPPHAAMKYLVPLARANKQHCQTLVDAIGDTRLSDRDVAALYEGWRQADTVGKWRLCQEPLLYLRAMRAEAAGKKAGKSPGTDLMNELGILGAVAWRARKHIHEGLAFETKYKRTELHAAWCAAENAFNDLARTFAEALSHAGSDDSDGHPGAS
jgi:ParB-like chromosome segregation protein Spo0J